MFAKILIPLDASRLAEQVLPCALAIARRVKAEVTLLRVVPPLQRDDAAQDGRQVELDELTELAQREAREYLNGIAGPLHDEGLSVKTALETGTPAECILDYANSMGSDLIAMSTHGRSAVGRWVFGSVADRVLRGASCPVLLTRGGETPGGEPPMRRIAVTLDGTAVSEQVVPHAAGMARAFGAEILLMRVVRAAAAVYASAEAMPVIIEDNGVDEAEAADYLSQWQARLSAEGCTARVMVTQPPVAEAVLDLARAHRADLIAMSTRGRSGVRRWMFGSVAERILQAATVPILLVRAGEKPPLGEPAERGENKAI